jgi:PRTRC genetic system protein B
MRINSCTSETTVKLRKAILIYEGGSVVTASFHNVERASAENGEDGPPLILPGAPLSQDALVEIYRKLAGSQKQARALLPENALCAESGRLAWYRPMHRAPIFFKPTDKKDKALAALNGKPVLHPTLLFVAEARNLYIFALAGSGNSRPNASTPVYVAPYYNLWANGHMCAAGRLPKSAAPRDIETYERAFFDTNFSHTNRAGKALTNHPGGHLGLWREMAQTGRNAPRTFCTKYLIPTGKKVEDLLNGKL